jgi:hypothetical protein
MKYEDFFFEKNIVYWFLVIKLKISFEKINF